jgi:hypothetical protein
MSSKVAVCVNECQLPDSYCSLLETANGFVLKRSWFRLFGVKPGLAHLDIHEWNRSPWIAEYGELAAGLVFFAEDVFGDQYAFRFVSPTREPTVVKFWCEGGEVQDLGVTSLERWLLDTVFSGEPSFLDRSLAVAAFQKGLRPSGKEHLSFILPLVTGGSAEVENLEVLDRVFHLHLLGQLSLKNQRLPEGERIVRFWSES